MMFTQVPGSPNVAMVRVGASDATATQALTAAANAETAAEAREQWSDAVALMTDAEVLNYARSMIVGSVMFVDTDAGG